MQEATVVARLRSPKARKATRHWEGVDRAREVKQLDVERVWQAKRWDDELHALALNVLADVWAEEGAAVFDVVDIAGKALPAISAAVVFDLQDPQVIRRLAAQATRVVGINETTRAAIASALVQGEQAGESIPKLTARVRGVFDTASTTRARTIARTEMSTAHNMAQLEAARQTGVLAAKEWLAVGDHRTRGEHLEADGQVQPIGSPFSVGGEDLDGPGDPSGSAGNVINCRCVVLYHDEVPAGSVIGSQPE